MIFSRIHVNNVADSAQAKSLHYPQQGAGASQRGAESTDSVGVSSSGEQGSVEIGPRASCGNGVSPAKQGATHSGVRDVRPRGADPFRLMLRSKFICISLALTTVSGVEKYLIKKPFGKDGKFEKGKTLTIEFIGGYYDGNVLYKYNEGCRGNHNDPKNTLGPPVKHDVLDPDDKAECEKWDCFIPGEAVNNDDDRKAIKAVINDEYPKAHPEKFSYYLQKWVKRTDRRRRLLSRIERFEREIERVARNPQ